MAFLEMQRRSPAESAQVAAAKADQKPTRQQKPVNKSHWPRSIAEAEVASQTECGTPKECRSEQRDYSDLKAQWEAARATRSAERAGWWQAVIAAVGVVLILATLWVTLWTSRRQLRAYITVEKATVKVHAGKAPSVWITFKNTGTTPAFEMAASSAIEIMLSDRRIKFPMKSMIDSGVSSVGPGNTFQIGGLGDVQLSVEQVERMKSGELAVYIHGHVIYRTFGKMRLTGFAFQSWHHDDRWQMRPCKHGNEGT